MRKKLLKVLSLVLVLIITLPFCVSAYTIEELEQMANGTVTDSGEGYYLLEKDGKTHYIDENGYIYGEYCISTADVVDLAPFINGETDEFLGVKVVEVTALFQDGWVDNIKENNGVFPYVVVLQDLFAGDEAEAVWSANEDIVNCHRNGYTSLPDVPNIIKGDVNDDGVVDVFDCLKVKGQYFGTATLTDLQLERADINGDGEIDMFDYLEVKKIYFEQ